VPRRYAKSQKPDTTKVDFGRPAFPRLGTRHARRSTLRQTIERSRSAYLRVALTYMLISMPHGTSTIFGVFQAILALLGCRGRTSTFSLKLSRDEKFASEFFCF